MTDHIRSEDPVRYYVPNRLGCPHLQKIVSGGQTGVDRAALDIALAHSFPAGGWCPEGRRAEDGMIPERYPVKELPGAGYRLRTKHNVIDSDGTLIIYCDRLSGGTGLTVQFCIQLKKPYLLIDADYLSQGDAVEKCIRFMNQEMIGTLNVAGPRASSNPAAYYYTRELTHSILNESRMES